eukprot:scaffold1016_cov258-Pinguiococcus_pyrenoidosus.AAC.16
MLAKRVCHLRVCRTPHIRERIPVVVSVLHVEQQVDVEVLAGVQHRATEEDDGPARHLHHRAWSVSEDVAIHRLRASSLQLRVEAVVPAGVANVCHQLIPHLPLRRRVVRRGAAGSVQLTQLRRRVRHSSVKVAQPGPDRAVGKAHQHLIAGEVRVRLFRSGADDDRHVWQVASIGAQRLLQTPRDRDAVHEERVQIGRVPERHGQLVVPAGVRLAGREDIHHRVHPLGQKTAPQPRGVADPGAAVQPVEEVLPPLPSGGLRTRVQPRRAGHGDRPMEQAFGTRGGQQGKHTGGAGALAVDGDPIGIAPEVGDVVPEPRQRGELVLQAQVPRSAEQRIALLVQHVHESEDVEAVVDLHGDHLLGSRQRPRAPVAQEHATRLVHAGSKRQVSSVDEDHHRQWRLLLPIQRALRRVHVQEQAV